MQRRTYLGTVSCIAFAGLSGCSSGPETSCADTQKETKVPTYGSDDAPTVEIFVDYTCPGCQEYHAQQVPDLKSAADDGTLQIVHRDFPLPHSDWSEPAAYVGRAVLDSAPLDSFWTYLEKTLAEDNLSKDAVITHATDAGLSGDTVSSELESSQYCNAVASSKQRGEDAGVEGTPQLYYNDELHDPVSAQVVIDSLR